MLNRILAQSVPEMELAQILRSLLLGAASAELILSSEFDTEHSATQKRGLIRGGSFQVEDAQEKPR